MTLEENLNMESWIEDTQDDPDIRICFGIVGDTTNNDLVMTRLQLRKDFIEKTEIRVVGSEHTKSRAETICKLMQQRKLEDIEMDINFDEDKIRENHPIDALHESIIRAIDDYYHPRQRLANDAILNAITDQPDDISFEDDGDEIAEEQLPPQVTETDSPESV